MHEQPEGDFVVPGDWMNFGLTDDQELIRKSVGELASKFASARR